MRYCPRCGTTTDADVCPHDGTPTVRKVAHSHGRLQGGDVITGRYRILGELGRGGFGVVFDAVHVTTGHPVAVKVLTSSGGDEAQEMARRFFQEASTTSRLSHPNTVRVFDFGQTDDGEMFLAMERLNGETLQTLLLRLQCEGLRMTEAQVVDVGVAVLKSLAEAHAHGLVHRDMKPANIFLHQVSGGEQIVKVLDFGIVKDTDTRMTQAGKALGTPTHMSPEQAMGKPVDARADIYALGVVLYECLVGALPFSGDNPLAIVMQHVTEPPPPILQRTGGHVRPALAAAVERALAKLPDDRWQSAPEMRDALQAALGQVPRTGMYRVPTIAPTPSNTRVRQDSGGIPGPTPQVSPAFGTGMRADSPAALQSGASPVPLRSGASPVPLRSGASPVPLRTGASPVPLRTGASPVPLRTGASPVPLRTGASPVPTNPRPQPVRPESGTVERRPLTAPLRPPSGAQPTPSRPSSAGLQEPHRPSGLHGANPASAATTGPRIVIHREPPRPAQTYTSRPDAPRTVVKSTAISQGTEAIPSHNDSAAFRRAAMDAGTVVNRQAMPGDDGLVIGSAILGSDDAAAEVIPVAGRFDVPARTPPRAFDRRPAPESHANAGTEVVPWSSGLSGHAGMAGLPLPGFFGQAAFAPTPLAVTGLNPMAERMMQSLQEMANAQSNRHAPRAGNRPAVSALWLSDDARRAVYAEPGGALHLVELGDLGDHPVNVLDLGNSIEVGSHATLIAALAGASDGRLIASGSVDGLLRGWDPSLGKQVGEIRFESGVQALAVATDGKLLAVGLADGTAVLVELPVFEVRRTLRGHRDAITAVAAAGSRRVVVTASDDGVVRTWDPVGGGARLTARGHEGAVGAVAVSGSGQVFVSGGWDGKLCAWSGRDGQRQFEVAAHDDVIAGIALDRAAVRVATAGDDRAARVWSATDGRLLAERRDFRVGVKFVRFTDDHRNAVLCGSWDGTFRRITLD
ncbi:MAG: hypothetical protein EXR79_05975 [Myxococcales bacterium]|nr:hypothetical protein [Myxococcales bacterium]